MGSFSSSSVHTRRTHWLPFVSAQKRTHTHTTDTYRGSVQNQWASLLPFVYIYLYFFLVSFAPSSSTFQKADAINHRKRNKLLLFFFFFRLAHQHQQQQQRWRWQNFTLNRARASFSQWIGYLSWYRRSFVFSLISAVALFGLRFYRFTSDDWIWYSVSVETHSDVRHCTI